MISRGEAPSRAAGVLLVVALAAAAAGCGDRHDAPGACADPAPSYVACGCGCCTGAQPRVQCLEAGQTICDVARADRDAASSPQCALAGCASGTEYRVCGP